MSDVDEMPLLVLHGPTASGKTSLAIEVAGHLAGLGRSAEIINADSMVVYRGMDIGTATPTPQEQAAVRHHLVSVWEPQRAATVAEFQAEARAAIADCRDRGVVPMLVGGSSLYVRAIIDVFDFPGTDPQIRARLEADLARIGVAAMYERLVGADPDAAAGIEPGNGRRIVRALEVIELTGSYTSQLPAHTYALGATVQVGLGLSREELDRRIAARVEAMWAAGFVDEVRGLMAHGLAQTRTASRALGYRQVMQFLSGDITQEQAKEATIVATRRFSRKQLGWFRRDSRITWLDATLPVDELVEAVAALLAGADIPPSAAFRGE